MKTKFLFLVIISLVVFNIAHAQWQLLNGPYGLNTTNMVQYGNKWFASTSNGLMESTNSGSDWVRSNEPFNMPVLSHVVSENEKMVYNGVYQNSGYISLDSGATWNQIVPDSAYPLLQVRIDSGSLYAWCSYSTIHISHDNGLTWNTCNRPVQNSLNDFEVNQGRLYLLYGPIGAGSGGIYYSDDDGTSWNSLGTAGIPSGAITHPFRMRFSGNAMYALYDSYGLYKSIDGGNTWAAFNNGLPGIFLTSPRLPYFDVKNNNVYICSNLRQGLFWSDTTAASFSNISSGLPAEISSEQIIEKGNTLYTMTTAGIFSTDKSNVQWQFTGRGVSEVLINDIVCQDSNVFVGHNSGFTVSHNNGLSFPEIVASTSTRSFYQNQTTIAAATAYGFSSTNGGSTWTDLNFTYGYNAQQLTGICENSGGMIGLNIDGTLKSSSTGGASWSTLTFPGGTPYCLGSGSNSFFAGTFSGIYRSTVLGGSWALSLSGNEINKIITENGITYAISIASNAIWYTTDDGASWNSLNYPGSTVRSLAVHSGIIVVAPEMKTTFDFGAHWYDLNIPLPNYQSVDLVALNNDYLFAVHTDSVYQLSTAFLNSVPGNPSITGFTVYPIPARDELFIKLNQQVSSSGKIEIRINDLTGKLLSKENLEAANNHRINLSSFPRGILIIELRTDNSVEYRKFIHL